MKNSEKGFILPVLVIMVLGLTILLLGILPFSSNQILQASNYESKLKARFAAEAGAKRAIREVKNYIAQCDPSSATYVPGSDLKNCKTTSDVTGTIDGTQSYSYSYSPKWLPSTPTTSSPDYILIESSSAVKGVKVPARVRVNISTEAIKETTESLNFKANALDLIKSANKNAQKNCFSNTSGKNGKPWLVNETEGYASHLGTAKDRILFENTLAKDFSINYVFEYTKIGGSGGPGVIYGAGATDTAEKFNAYWAKFNYQRESFAVTKSLISNNTSPDPEMIFNYGSAKILEADNKTLKTVANYCNDYQGNTNNIDARAFQPNGIGVSNSATSFDIAADANATDPLGNPVGRCSIPLDNLKKIMDNYYNKLREVKTKVESGIPVSSLTAKEQDYYNKYTVYFAGRTIPNEFNYNENNASVALALSIQTETFRGDVQQGNIAVLSDNSTIWQKTTKLTNQELTRHRILLDGNEILNFVDYSVYYTPYSAITAKNTKTGNTTHNTSMPTAGNNITFSFSDNKKITYNSNEAGLWKCYNADLAKIKLGTTGIRSGLTVTNIDPGKMKFYNYTSISYGETVSNVISAGDIIWLK